MSYIFIALAPVVIILFYIYYRDKYEKEPLGLILRGLFFGMIIVLPIIFIERIISGLGDGLSGLQLAAWTSFAVAGFTEEIFKLIAVLLLIWRNPNFNEKFDGIVYAASVSLGFAAVENIMYVFQHGMQVGYARAFTAVPAHAIFGVIMGYYLGMAKFVPQKRAINLLKAFFIPFLFHGFYDFIIFSQKQILLILFFPFLLFMFWIGQKGMKTLSDKSIFRNNDEYVRDDDNWTLKE